MRIQFEADNVKGFRQYTHSFELIQPPHSLVIKTRTAEGSMLNWFLYNPAGNLYGQACLLNEGTDVKAFVQDGAVLYGASNEKADAGKWVLLVLGVYLGSTQGCPPWTLEVTTEENTTQSAEVPAIYWMEDAGRISRDYLIREKRAEVSFYKGDFHLHTTCSDGMMPPSRLQQEAYAHALDFFAITDHNFFHTGWVDGSMTVLPGMELTLDDGHFNLFAPERLPHYRLAFWQDHASDFGSINAVIELIREAGALTSVNHPFIEPWQVKNGELDLSLFNTMEIISDPTYISAPQASEKAIKAFTVLWDHGIQLTGIGGSDLHNAPGMPYDNSDIAPEIGMPATWIYADRLSINALKEGLRAHSVYVACGFQIDFGARYGETNYPIGSKILCDADEPVLFTFTLKGADRSYTAEIVEDGGSRTKLILDGNQSASFARQWGTGYHWLRVDVRDSAGVLCGFTNPIYSGCPLASKLLWRNLVELI